MKRPDSPGEETEGDEGEFEGSSKRFSTASLRTRESQWIEPAGSGSSKEFGLKQPRHGGMGDK